MDKIVRCEKCGAMVKVLIDCTCENCGIKCCGETMKDLVAGSVDASKEKHVPVVKIDNTKVYVSVGSAEHPMEKAHYIEWVWMQTKTGAEFKRLKPGEKPEVVFNKNDGEEVVRVYAYCNLHGLWKS